MDSTLYNADCIEKLKSLDENSVGACVTDPPYFLSDENTFESRDLLDNSYTEGKGFMGRDWDGGTVEVVKTDSTPILNVSKPVKWIKVNGHFIEPENILQLKNGEHEKPVYKRKLNVYYEFCKLWGQELLRVLKPGAYVAAFSGTRTYHSMTQALEDVGLKIKDSIHWMYGNGFPKSMNISLRIDRHKGLEREYIAENPWGPGQKEKTTYAQNGRTSRSPITKPNSKEAQKYDGYGTALKPAHEPIVVAMKPVEGTYVENLLNYGTGAINIDEGRVNTKKNSYSTPEIEADEDSEESDRVAERVRDKGRFPSNVIIDRHIAEKLDCQAGDRSSTRIGNENSPKRGGNSDPVWGMSNGEETVDYRDSGGPSRFFKQIEWDKEKDNPFFYCSKASRSERLFGEIENPHPTLKPVRLMWYLVKLFVPEDETVIDPFMGSGTTGCASVVERKDFIGIESNENSFKIAKDRIGVFREKRKEVINEFINKEDQEPKKDMSDEHNFW